MPFNGRRIYFSGRPKVNCRCCRIYVILSITERRLRFRTPSTTTTTTRISTARTEAPNEGGVCRVPPPPGKKHLHPYSLVKIRLWPNLRFRSSVTELLIGCVTLLLAAWHVSTRCKSVLCSRSRCRTFLTRFSDSTTKSLFSTVSSCIHVTFGRGDPFLAPGGGSVGGRERKTRRISRNVVE